MKTITLGFVVLGLALATGCDKSDDKTDVTAEEGRDEGDDKGKKKKKSDDDDRDEAADDKKGKGAGDEVAPVVGTAPPVVTPGGRSTVPTLEEWNAVTKEVTVRGSSALNCETKMVREWLRVSCRGKSSTGGEPTGVTVTSGGGRGDDFAFTGPGVASLVVRFVEGVDLQASFTWTDRSHTLRVWWPRGAPEPPPKGEFIGVTR